MKILNPFSLHRHVSFDYAGSIDAGINLLSNYIIKPTFQLKLDDGLVGTIDTDKVEIWLHRPFSRNFLIPVFSGVFITDNGKTKLIGDFRLHKYTKKIFGFAQVAMIAFWIYVRIADQEKLITSSQKFAPLWFCLGTMLFMFASLYLFRPIAKTDMQTIEQQISNILTNGHI